MEYLELPAPPPLDALVHCFWFLRGGDTPAAPQTIVADGRIDIVLHLASPFAQIDATGAPQVQAEVLLAGQLTAPIRVAPSGAADVIGIRFRTAAASAVLSAPLSEFTNRVEPLSSVAPGLSSALLDAATRHESRRERVAALSSALARFVRARPDTLACAAARVLSRIAAPRVAELGAALSVSTRTIERRVLDHTGLSPNALRRVMRFRRVFRMLEQAPPGTWAAVATAAGYFDQAHLIRDFRQFAGVPPSQFYCADADLARAFIGAEESAA